MTALAPETQSSRGKPVIALVSVLVLWIGLRIVFWQSPLVLPAVPEPESPARASSLAIPLDARTSAPDGPSDGPRALVESDADWTTAPVYPRVDHPISHGPVSFRHLNGGNAGQGWQRTGLSDARLSGTPPIAARRIVGHNLLLASGLSSMPVSPLLEPYLQGRGSVALRQQDRPQTSGPLFGPAAEGRFATEPASTGSGSRWSMDVWALWRKGGAAPSLASTQPSYGRSQIGTVLRYTLAPGDARRPQAHLRASSALEGPPDREIGLGLSARPLAGVPVRLAAEARIADRRSGHEVRAAAYAVSEFPPLDLPGGLTGEAYVQAGYVSGNFATGFVDGQVRVTRDLGGDEDFRLRAGGGVWGGAQDGASRLDVGPSASVTVRLGTESYGRLSADYRFRVAGDAAPSSGPALTLSAGF